MRYLLASILVLTVGAVLELAFGHLVFGFPLWVVVMIAGMIGILLSVVRGARRVGSDTRRRG